MNDLASGCDQVAALEPCRLCGGVPIFEWLNDGAQLTLSHPVIACTFLHVSIFTGAGDEPGTPHERLAEQWNADVGRVQVKGSTAFADLVRLAEQLRPTGEIGDGMVAQFNDLARRLRHEWGVPLETTNYPDQVPIPMVLHCPVCHVQHIDRATAEWDNPPHRSHACQTPGCGTIWRPADVATAGVAAISTRGKSDNWPRSEYDEMTIRGDR